MHSSGQLSLEYLLLLAAVLSIFALLLPLLNNVYELSLFGLDSVNAKSFAFALQEAIEELSFQADGAAIYIPAKPLTQWELSCSGKQLLLRVQGPSQRQKSFEVGFPNNLAFGSASIGSETVFRLKKVSGQILLEYD